MSVLPPPPLGPLQRFFRSVPMPCPYLPGMVERKLFTRIAMEVDPSGRAGPEPAFGAGTLNSTLTRAGFRRSHDIAYRPVCPGCTACVPVRVPVAGYTQSPSERRIAKRNADLVLSEASPAPTMELYRLFAAYQRARHGEGDMARMSEADYAAMVADYAGSGTLFVLRERDADGGQGRLHAALLADRVSDGVSAVYSFFDPAESARSLGTQVILSVIAALSAEFAGTGEAAYVYLGYWIAGARKMAYKARFRPLEILGAKGWEPAGALDAPAA